MKCIVVKNGTIITAERNLRADIVIEDGKITSIGEGPDTASPSETYDASGKFVLPGGVDPHTHFGMTFQGEASIDDYATGSQAALLGGTTTIINAELQASGRSMVDAIEIAVTQASSMSWCDFGLHLWITDLKKKPDQEITQLVNLGISSFKCTTAFKGLWQIRVDQMYSLINACKRQQALLILKAEDGDQIAGRVAEMTGDKKKGVEHYPDSRPPLFEQQSVFRVTTLAKTARFPIYVAGVSCRDTTNLLMQLNEDRVTVFAETTPYYLVFSDERYSQPDASKYVVAPPLRPQDSITALWRAVGAGLIDVVSSEHAAYSLRPQKERFADDFSKIPPGIPGVQERLSVLHHFGVLKKRISINQLVALTSTTPAKRFGLFPQKGTIAVGSDADLVIFDPDEIWEVGTDGSSNDLANPYLGLKLVGKSQMVFSRGRLVAENGTFLAPPEKGRFLKRSQFQK